jgi:hypothetical protein
VTSGITARFSQTVTRPSRNQYTPYAVPSEYTGARGHG